VAKQAANNDYRTGCGCLAAIVVVAIIVAAVAGGGGGGKGTSSSPEKEAREYISQKGHNINVGRVDYEHVALLVGLASKAGGESTTVVDELAKVAQEAHNEIDSFREELFKTDGNKKLQEATFELSEGANELKNAMGGLIAYTGNPNPATLAHFTIQLEAAKGKWNEGVDQIWTIAREHGAYRLK
jgi:hypothetical protein